MNNLPVSLLYLGIMIIGSFIVWTRLRINNTEFGDINKFPLVSVIVPARNEEKNIERLLNSLLKLRYPNYEVFVIEGGSEDDTRDLVKHYSQVKIIEEPPKPHQWVGKPWACHVGSLSAKGDVLLFTDADTYHHPDSLRNSVSILNKSKGFVTMVTTQNLISFWEHMLVIVFLMISTAVNGVKGNARSTIANGQYMMFTREAYNKIGGHEVVYNSIIEDLTLGTIAARKGIPPDMIYSKDMVNVRMYDSLSDIQEGFSKNLALGLESVGIKGFLPPLVVTLWGMGYFLIMIFVPLNQILIDMVLVTVMFVGYVSFVCLLLTGEKYLSNRYSITAFLYPIYFVAFWWITIQSLVQRFIFKEITWKGRVSLL